MSHPQEQPLTLSAFIIFYEKKIEPRFFTIETEMREFKNETTERFEKVFAELEKLNQEHTFFSHQLNRLDKRLEALENRVQGIEISLQELKNETTLQTTEILIVKRELQALNLRQINAEEQYQHLRLQGGKNTADMTRMIGELEGLKLQVNALETRIQQLENFSKHSS